MTTHLAQVGNRIWDRELEQRWPIPSIRIHSAVSSNSKVATRRSLKNESGNEDAVELVREVESHMTNNLWHINKLTAEMNFQGDWIFFNNFNRTWQNIYTKINSSIFVFPISLPTSKTLVIKQWNFNYPKTHSLEAIKILFTQKFEFSNGMWGCCRRHKLCNWQ